MIKEFVDCWNKNKNALQAYIQNNQQSKYADYEELVRLIFEIVINPERCGWVNKYDTKRIHRIDDGDYQGTLIFLIPQDTYQPGIEDYIVASVYYGSCSGCDTLLAICDYDYDNIPNEKQVKDYMTLCLHLLQSMKPLADADDN